MEEIFKDEVQIPDEVVVAPKEVEAPEPVADGEKVINFGEFADALKKKEVLAQQAVLADRIHEGVKKLPKFVGDVASKNTIRGLPNTKVGDIYWSEMDKQPYVVINKDDKKVTLQELNSTASLSAGITIYEITKDISSKEPLVNWEDKEAVDKLIVDFLEWKKEIKDKYFLLVGLDIQYVTVFKEEEGTLFNGVKEAIQEVGELISMDFEGSDVEIWIRTNKEAAALLYLIPYDKGLWLV
jgi:hypothetical protein